jgi:hypothetical protein
VKGKKIEPEKPPARLTVTEQVSLDLEPRVSAFGSVIYHQTATNDDLLRFVRAVDRKFGPAHPITIHDGRLSATRTDEVSA